MVELQGEKDKILKRNQDMEAKIKSLKNGLGSIEAHARQDLGMIRKGETFFQIIEEPHPKNDKQR